MARRRWIDLPLRYKVLDVLDRILALSPDSGAHVRAPDGLAVRSGAAS